MAHFVELNENNIVIRGIVVSNSELLDDQGIESEQKGKDFCTKHFGGNWIQTSYNKRIRKNYAGIGFTYDQEKDAFIPPKPYPSWFLDEENCIWEAPIEYPKDGKIYHWNEKDFEWQLLEN